MSTWMNLYRRFTIRFRMNSAIGVVLGLFLIVGGVALYGGLQLQAIQAHTAEHALRELQLIADLRANLGDVRRFEKDQLLSHDHADLRANYRTQWEAAQSKVREALTALQQGEEDEDNVLAREALTHLDRYRTDVLAVLAKAGQPDAGGAHELNEAMGAARAAAHEIEGRLNQIAGIVDAEAKEGVLAFSGKVNEASWVFALVLLAVAAVVIPTTIWNARSIVIPIRQAQAVAEAIAAGDLRHPIDIAGQDEPANLMRALQQMQHTLQTVVGEVRITSGSISVASAEIASGNQDLSGRTEQSAASLEQTASSMEQLTDTVRQTADSARTANQLASSAAQAAQRGGDVVSQVVSNMQEITASSRKIGEIIGVIDGIAFQTNILALNAAVEAARAGEQGRGFAVVAGEVRNLAQRSATAAREIKTLINASVEKVESGSRLVQDAGATMGEIVSGVQRVSDIIGEITAATSEQSGELGQVNVAVTHLDQMTQQNAALVEQSAAAAESLKDQADKLAGVVSVFRLASDPDRAVRPEPAPRAEMTAAVAPARVPTVRTAASPRPTPVAASTPLAPSSSTSFAPATSPASSPATADSDWETF